MGIFPKINFEDRGRINPKVNHIHRNKVMERFLEHDSSLQGVPADMIAQVRPLS